jgi:putative ATP-binding cassette transporter
LEAFHSRKITLERRKGGAILVSDINLVQRKGTRNLLVGLLGDRHSRPKVSMTSSKATLPQTKN